jgi:hypothetical protein
MEGATQHLVEPRALILVQDRANADQLPYRLTLDLGLSRAGSRQVGLYLPTVRRGLSHDAAQLAAATRDFSVRFLAPRQHLGLHSLKHGGLLRAKPQFLCELGRPRLP